ncbi:glycosyltransferase family 1 protein [Candidatus Bathyarchaeota archaeon]|nr:glycosyltransferase family 1 protein [Candidatus Bathyarchaeota archaeon]
MRVAFFLTQYMEIGGVENVVREVAKRLKKRHKVYLIIRDRKQNTEPEKFWDGFLKIPSSEKFHQFLKSRKLVEKYIQKNKIDLVNFHNWSPAAPFVFSKFKKVITMHGSSSERQLNEGRWYAFPFMWLVEEIAMNSCDAITSITKHHMRLFALFKPLKTVYNGVDTKFFSPATVKRATARTELKISGFTGLFIGKFLHVKGLKYLLDAARELEDVHFVIIGDGEEKYLLENAPKNVRWIGAIYDKKVLRKYYSAADFLVIPSINEGLPLVLLEGLSMGLPVVGTDAGGIPEILRRGGGIAVPKKNPKAIVCAIESIRMKKLKRKAETVFDWNDVTKGYEDLFESVMRGSK